MAHKFSHLEFALLVSSIFVVAAPGFLDQRADLRPGDSGKTLYHAASLIHALYAAALFSAFLVAPRWRYWQHPWGAVAAATCAFLAWLFALQAASSACKARLGARLKRCGWQIIGFTKPHTSSTNAPPDFHPRHWLPFYQPWVLYKQGEITRTEMATTMFASARSWRWPPASQPKNCHWRHTLPHFLGYSLAWRPRWIRTKRG